MAQSKQVAALARWLSDLTYIGIRNVETPALVTHYVREDGRPLRGVHLMSDLVLTRQKTFYRIVDQGSAIPMTHAEVMDQYGLETLQQQFKSLKEQWKLSRISTVS